MIPSQRFLDSVVQRVAANCPDDLSSAENLGQVSLPFLVIRPTLTFVPPLQQFCNIVSASLTYPAAPTTTPIASSSGSASTSPTTSANAASGAFKSENGLWTLAALLFGAAAL